MSDPVDIRDLSVGDVLRSVRRLKLSSALWIVASAIFVIGGAYSAGMANNYLVATGAAVDGNDLAAKKPVFTPLFTEHFVDREYLALILPGILEESPDGIESDAEAMASLLWQLKAQDGYAEFLTGRKFVSVQVTYSDESFNFEWNTGNSVILKILNHLSLPAGDSVIIQLNSEMNLLGVAWLPDGQRIVRSLDGGLAFVGKE